MKINSPEKLVVAVHDVEKSALKTSTEKCALAATAGGNFGFGNEA